MQYLILIALAVIAIIAIAAGLASATDNLARAKEAQAAIEASRTAEIATAGLAVGSVAMTALVVFLVLVVIGLVGVIAYMAWRSHRQQHANGILTAGRMPAGQNARAARPGQAQLTTGAPVLNKDDIQMLTQLATLRLLSGLVEDKPLKSYDKPSSEDDSVIW